MATNLNGHVFISYCHSDRSDVKRFRLELINTGIPVWWDQDILPGHDWKHEIRRGMQAAKAVILCLSKSLDGHLQSGVYPEMYDAISEYRQYSPGSIYIIPVRLSECSIPAIELDGTRTLDGIQYIDLFPENERNAALQKILESLKHAGFTPS